MRLHILKFMQGTHTHDHSNRLTDSAIGKIGSPAKRADEEAPPGESTDPKPFELVIPRAEDIPFVETSQLASTWNMVWCLIGVITPLSLWGHVYCRCCPAREAFVS